MSSWVWKRPGRAGRWIKGSLDPERRDEGHTVRPSMRIPEPFVAKSPFQDSVRPTIRHRPCPETLPGNPGFQDERAFCNIVHHANSLRSTGPRTTLGKSVSKLNGLVHGMRAESDILPGEDPEALDRRIATWADELGAETGPERYLAEAAAKASWRIDRCRGAETAALSRQVLRAGEDYDDALAEEVERLGGLLQDDPAGVVRQLRRSPAGCRWLIGRWEGLAERLVGWKALEPTERYLAANLMGRRHDDLFDPGVARLTAAYLGALRLDAERACEILRDDRPEGMGEVEFDRRVGSLCAALPDSSADHAQQVATVAE